MKCSIIHKTHVRRAFFSPQHHDPCQRGFVKAKGRSGRAPPLGPYRSGQNAACTCSLPYQKACANFERWQRRFLKGRILDFPAPQHQPQTAMLGYTRTRARTRTHARTMHARTRAYKCVRISACALCRLFYVYSLGGWAQQYFKFVILNQPHNILILVPRFKNKVGGGEARDGLLLGPQTAVRQ